MAEAKRHEAAAAAAEQATQTPRRETGEDPGSDGGERCAGSPDVCAVANGVQKLNFACFVLFFFTHTCTHTDIHVCVCVCACGKEERLRFKFQFGTAACHIFLGIKVGLLSSCFGFKFSKTHDVIKPLKKLLPHRQFAAKIKQVSSQTSILGIFADQPFKPTDQCQCVKIFQRKVCYAICHAWLLSVRNKHRKCHHPRSSDRSACFSATRPQIHGSLVLGVGYVCSEVQTTCFCAAGGGRGGGPEQLHGAAAVCGSAAPAA